MPLKFEENHMSQVSYSFERIPLSDIVDRLSPDDQVVAVQGPVSQKVFCKVIFQKDTHYKKDEETVYEEFVSEYMVIQVIRSAVFKAGDRFWVWNEPAYTFKDVKRYHETGLSRSPDILERTPEFPPDGDKSIVFITRWLSKTSAEYPLVYSIKAMEGPGAEEKIRALISVKARSWSKPWWRFWK
jgi:hypothetical protein